MRGRDLFRCPRARRPSQWPRFSATETHPRLPDRGPAMMPTPPAPEGETQFSCPECGQFLRVPASLAGQPVECPRCRKWVEVPHASEPAPPAQAGYNPYGLSDEERREYERL